MSHIAILHPQCARLGGAIQMALQTAQVLLKQGHKVVVYTFEKNDACFPELQAGLDIRVWDSARKVGFLPLRKLVAITSLAWELRHVDIIIANNPPMQIVAALTKVFSLKIKYKGRKGRNDENEGMTEHNNRKARHYSLFIIHFSLSTASTLWWHHHVPWYLPKEMKKGRNEEMKNEGTKLISQIGKKILHFRHYLHYSLFIGCKSFLERHLIIPRIDQMIATSYFVAENIQMYCGREAMVIHPIIQMNNEEMKKGKKAVSFPSLDKVTLFTHGRLEPGKGLDMLVRVFERMNNEKPCLPAGRGIMKNGGINLIIFGTGSLEKELREKGINVQPFDRKNTFRDILSGQYGHVLGVYCSQIDAFGMAPLEAQAAGISTVILDSGGARETILTNLSDKPVGYLVHSEEDLLGTIKDYVQIKSFPKKLSNVNFSHKREYFTPERLSSDISSIIEKTRV